MRVDLKATERLLGTKHVDYRMAVEGLRRARAALVSTLTRLDMSPEELRARGARAKLYAEAAALRREVESLRREKACVTPSPADSESDLD